MLYYKDMVRLARVVAIGAAHHITQRGNRRQKVFFHDEDYAEYLRLMREWCDKCGVEVWAYCLMPNHVHLIAVPESCESLARGIGEAHRRYTRMINFRENWRGYLWQGRFASYPLDDQYLLTAARYVELNPVRARLVKEPKLYEWSSANAHILSRDDVLVKATPLCEIAGVDWEEFLREGMKRGEANLLRQHERTGRPLGSENFVKRLERRLERALRPQKRGPKPRE